jgi:hypothetical protein
MLCDGKARNAAACEDGHVPDAISFALASIHSWGRRRRSVKELSVGPVV